MSIPVFKAPIKRKEMDAVLTTLVDEQLGPGTYSKKLVSETAKFLGSAGGAAFRETIRAIRTALHCLQLEKGSAVVLSPLAPAVYIDCLLEQGLVPLYADCEEAGVGISAAQVERLVEEFDLKAMIVTTTLGFVPDLETLSTFKIPIIEDVSNGYGATTGLYKCGSYGDYTIISLEYDNIITAGGGAILLGRGRREYQLIKKASSSGGKSILLPDMNAVLALTLLETHEKNLLRRREIAEIFSKACRKSRHRQVVQSGEGEHIDYSFPILLNSGLSEAMKYAMKKGVATLPSFEESALKIHQSDATPAPQAQSLILRSLLFPLYPGLSNKNIELISRVISTLP